MYHLYHLDSVLQVLVGEKNLSDSALSWPKRAGCAEQIWTDLQRHPLSPAGHLNWSRFRKEMVDWKVHQPTMEDTDATNSEWKEGYFVLFFFFFSRQVFFFGSWFYALLLLWFLLFCFSCFLRFLLLCFSCFSASLLYLLLFFSASLLSLLPCFSAFVLLCLSTSTILLFLFFSHAFLLLYFLLLCFSASCLYCLFVFSFVLLYSLLFVSLNETLKTLGETQRNPNEILTRTTDKKPLNETLNEP